MLGITIFTAVALLAYANGANDNFKGTATLWGSGTLDYKKALRLTTIATVAGALVSVFFAAALVKNFSGKGLVPDALAQSPVFLLAVAFGAGLTVLLATRLGFPISTTHGLVGALVGAGFAAAPDAVNLGKLGRTFFLPLLLSPVLALAAAVVFYKIAKTVRLKLGVSEKSMVLPTSHTAHDATVAPDGTMRMYAGDVLGIRAQPLLDTLHYLSAATVCFARGLNDAPKMAGLLVAVALFAPSVDTLMIAVAMALGGILQARRVAETMSKKITPLNHGQGFSANLVTGVLVVLASAKGLPVSTTHVSVGSLIGIGLVNGKADFSQIGKILLSWVLTLPVAALLSAAGYCLTQVATH